jgi:anti-anti-sigma regulatory factor
MNHAFVYYMHDESAAFRFQLAGDLSQDNTGDLEQARQTASSTFGGRSLIVDVTGVTSIDAAGRELLDAWHKLGARLVVNSAKAKRRIQLMTTVPIAVVRKGTEASKWLSFRAANLWVAALLALVTAIAARSAQSAEMSAITAMPATILRFTLSIAIECGLVFN